MSKVAADHHPHSSSSPLPLFIDTNLDTHLAILASPDDTIADLKGKIMTEHALCFPKFGEVAIQAVKVKRRVSFYHLSDSMLVKFAFSGINGSWFLHLDLEPMASIVKSQMETARVIVGENNGQPEEQNLLQTNCDLSLLPVTGEYRNQEFVVNGLSFEEDHIRTSAPDVRTSAPDVHESGTLLDTAFQMPYAQDASLLPIVSSPQKQSLHVSSNELDKRPALHAPEMELVTESNAVVGSNHRKISEQTADLGVEADADVPVVDSKKEKTRKRSSAFQKDQLPDGRSDHPCVEKKRHKKENEMDQPFTKGIVDHSSGENGHCSKEKSQLEKVLPENSQEKHENCVVLSEGFPSKPSHVEFSLQHTPVDGKQKKKKKKHLPTNDEPPRDEAVDNLFSKFDAILGKQATLENPVEQLVEDHNELGKEPGAADLIEESAHKELDGGPAEVGMENTLSTNLKISNHTTERLLRNTETSTEFPTQEVSNVDSDGPLHLNALAHGKESGATGICKEAEQPSMLSEEVPAISPRSRKISDNEKDVSCKYDVVDPSVKAADNGNIDETSGNNNDELSKASAVALNDADISNEIAMKSEIPSEITVKCLQHTRKKKSKKSDLPNVHLNSYETANSSIDQVPEENQNNVLSISKELPGEKLEGAAVPEDAAAAGKSSVVESTFTSNHIDKKKKRRQKKSEMIEAHHGGSNMQPSTYEGLDTSRDQAIEEFSNETTVGNLEHPGNESKQAAVLVEAVGNSITVPSDPNKKKLKRSRKKSEKTELPSGESTRAESVHSLIDKATEETPRESLEDYQIEKSGSHLGHAGKGSEDAAVLLNPSTADLLSPSDKKSLHVKKPGKAELPKKESSKGEAVDPLVKVKTKANPGETFGGITNGIGESSKSLTTLKEAVGVENIQVTVDNGSAGFVEAKDHGELPISDGQKLDFLKFFNPQANHLKPSPELHFLETETRKISKEKTKRKKKLNPSPQDSTNLLEPPVSDEQHTTRNKPQDSDSGKHSLSRPAEQIAKEVLLSSKKHKKKDANRKSDVNVPERSYEVGSPRRSNDDAKSGKKRQSYESKAHFEASLSSLDNGSKHPNGKNSMRTESKIQSLRHNEGVMDDLVASSDSTQEDTPVIKKQYRVAVRKVPKNRSAKVPLKFSEEKMTLAPSATIFNDATSRSSDDEFEIRNRKVCEKSTSDNSSTYADSDEGIEETQISYKNCPGSESMNNHKAEQKNNGAQSRLTKSPNVKTKGKPLNMILKSTSSYKKAKLSASQSEMEDSESQHIDVLPETQRELGLL